MDPLDAYAEHLIGAGLSTLTVANYTRRIATALQWADEHNVDLVNARPSEVQALAATFPRSHATLGQLAAALRHWWEMHERWNGPVRAIRVPSAPTMTCKAVEPVDARRLIEASDGWWPHGAAVIVGLTLGLRRTEIASMEWDRFDPAGEWYTVTGKYSKTATLPVHPFTWDQFARQRRRGKWIFPGRVDGHVNPATIWEWVREVGIEAGLPTLRPHQLRHTTLAEMNDVTGDLRGVQTFARHSRSDTTSGYTRTTRTRLRQLSESLSYLPRAS